MDFSLSCFPKVLFSQRSFLKCCRESLRVLTHREAPAVQVDFEYVYTHSHWGEFGVVKVCTLAPQCTGAAGLAVLSLGFVNIFSPEQLPIQFKILLSPKWQTRCSKTSALGTPCLRELGFKSQSLPPHARV